MQSKYQTSIKFQHYYLLTILYCVKQIILAFSEVLRLKLSEEGLSYSHNFSDYFWVSTIKPKVLRNKFQFFLLTQCLYFFQIEACSKNDVNKNGELYRDLFEYLGSCNNQFIVLRHSIGHFTLLVIYTKENKVVHMDPLRPNDKEKNTTFFDDAKKLVSA